MKTKPAVLIIGGTGFIGAYVAKILNERGHSVVVSYRHRPGAGKLTKGVIYQKGLKLDSKLYANIQNVIVAPRPDPLMLASALEHLGRIPKLKKIIYFSTFGLYPDSLQKQKETAKLSCISEYQRQKYYEEIVLKEFTKRLGVNLCIARLSNVYGDVQSKDIINLIVKHLLNKTKLIINGDGSQKRDFIFIEDAAELICYLTTRKQHNQYEVFNVCTGNGCSVSRVIKVLERLSGKRIIFRHAPFPDSERKNSIGDNTKVAVASGYDIRYPIIKGLKKTLDNYKKHSWKY